MVTNLILEQSYREFLAQECEIPSDCNIPMHQYKFGQLFSKIFPLQSSHEMEKVYYIFTKLCCDFKTWPSAKELFKGTEDPVQITLYKALYFSVKKLSVQDFVDSWNNYMDFFFYVNDESDPINLQIPADWMFGFIRTFYKQFLEFLKLNLSETEKSLIEKEKAWNLKEVENNLNDMIAKSKIEDTLKIVQNQEEIPSDGFSNSPFYQSLGYNCLVLKYELDSEYKLDPALLTVDVSMPSELYLAKSRIIALNFLHKANFDGALKAAVNALKTFSPEMCPSSDLVSVVAVCSKLVTTTDPIYSVCDNLVSRNAEEYLTAFGVWDQYSKRLQETLLEQRVRMFSVIEKERLASLLGATLSTFEDVLNKFSISFEVDGPFVHIHSKPQQQQECKFISAIARLSK